MDLFTDREILEIEFRKAIWDLSSDLLNAYSIRDLTKQQWMRIVF